jgi:hypothetical protein
MREPLGPRSYQDHETDCRDKRTFFSLLERQSGQ